MTKEKDSLKQLGSEYLEEALDLFYQNRLTEAELSASRAKVIFGDIGCNDEFARCLNVLGVIYGNMGNDELEINCYLEGLAIALEHNLYNRAASFYNNIGSKYQTLGANEQALEFFNKAKDALEGHEDYEDESYVGFALILNMNLCDMCAKAGATDLALEYLEKAKKVEDHPANKNFMFTFRSFEACFYWSIGMYEEAKALKDELISIAVSDMFSSDYLENMLDVCKLLRQMNDYDSWRTILEKVDASISADDGLYIKIASTELWMEYYKTLGEMEKYHELCVKFVELTIKKRASDNRAKAIAIDNKVNLRDAEMQRLKATEVSMYDTLTGVGNRNKLHADCIPIIEHSAKTKSLVGIGILDIDYFKECNDTYGHIEGDACLKAVAEVIAHVVGNRGNVYRFGGDEYVVLLDKITVDDISQIGAQIKKEIADLQIPNIKSPVSDCVTISQGYTVAIAEEGDEIDYLIDLADQVLYQVKRYGRNGYKYMRYEDILAME